MDKAEAWLERARDYWELGLLKFKRHQSIYYQGVVAFSVVFYLFMFGSGIILTKPNDIKTTEIGTELQANTLKFKLVDRSYNREKGLMELMIVGENESASYQKLSLKFDILVKGITEGQAKLKIVEGERNYFAVYVKDLPENWDGVMVNITEVADGSSSEVSFVTGGKSIDGTKETEIKTKEDVKVQSIDYQISLRKAERKSQQKEIQGIKKEITALKEEITLLEADLDYQTDKQIEQTKAAILGLTETIKQKDSSIRSIEEEGKEVDARIEKLKLKKKESTD